MASKIYVLDTNIILHNFHKLTEISESGTNILVIPETVLIELENFKKNFTELGYQARMFARMLAGCKVSEVDNKDDYRIVKMRHEEMILHLFAKRAYECDLDANYLSESHDKRIVEVAGACKEYYKGSKVIFLSLDIYARMFGLLVNVKVESLHEDKSEVPDFEFVKKIQLDEDIEGSIENLHISQFDSEYKNGNYSYEFLAPNGQNTYAIVSPSGHIHCINEEDDFKGLEAKPINLRQKFFMKAILQDIYDIYLIDAKAGSGKTLMAFVGAMRLVKSGRYEKIVYVRNSIESVERGAEIGYLSGNDEKMRIYNMALYDTLEFIAKKCLKKKEYTDYQMAIESKIEELMSKYNIEKLWPGEARGRTLSNAVVILDEWQNSSNNTTQLILSRLDNHSKAIVIGSNRQIDNMYLNKYNNGLTSLLKETKKEQALINLFAIELDTAVRGKFSYFADEIFGKGYKES